VCGRGQSFVALRNVKFTFEKTLCNSKKVQHHMIHQKLELPVSDTSDASTSAQPQPSRPSPASAIPYVFFLFLPFLRLYCRTILLNSHLRPAPFESPSFESLFPPAVGQALLTSRVQPCNAHSVPPSTTQDRSPRNADALKTLTTVVRGIPTHCSQLQTLTPAPLLSLGGNGFTNNLLKGHLLLLLLGFLPWILIAYS